MKVYILLDVDYSDVEICGIYHKQGDDQKEMNRRIEQTKESYILAFGDKWERYYRHNFEIVEEEVR